MVRFKYWRKNVENDWIIEPLKGVGPLRLGMDMNDMKPLTRILGPLYSSYSHIDENGNEFIQKSFDLESPVVVFKNKKLSEIQIDDFSRFNIIFNGIPIFGSPSKDVLSALEIANKGAHYGNDMVIFPDISIGTKGFYCGTDQFERKIYYETTSENIHRVINLEPAGTYALYLERYSKISFINS